MAKPDFEGTWLQVCERLAEEGHKMLADTTEEERLALKRRLHNSKLITEHLVPRPTYSLRMYRKSEVETALKRLKKGEVGTRERLHASPIALKSNDVGRRRRSSAGPKEVEVPAEDGES